MFLHSLTKKLFPKSLVVKKEFAPTMKSAVEIATEMNIARDKQMEAERMKRPDLAIIQKTKFETLLWVLGKDYATASVR